MSGQNGYAGTLDATAGQGNINAFAFLCASLINKICTMQPVKVIAVNATKETVDVQPLVNQIDGLGNATPHGVIHGLPYQRMQGGVSAVILDPVVNDIGFAVFASHDISSVKANKGQANPGSRRRYDWADGIYIGGVLNGTPTEFVKFSNGGGITITTPGTLAINANVVITGTVTNNGVNISSTHKHGGVQTGSGTSGVPQ
jgi:hypothetical protein